MHEFWNTFELDLQFNPITTEDHVQADLHNVSVNQYRFDKWLDCLNNAYVMNWLPHPIRLSRWKCWLWPFLPKSILGANKDHFMLWSIGHCLNCDADPYDGQVEAWNYGGGWYEGAMIRCNRCGNLRWQHGCYTIPDE